MRMLYALGAASPWNRTYPETAAGIARAATDDPFYPDREDGAEITAAILIAAAYDASAFHPYAHNSGRIGLFRLKPPGFPKPSPSSLVRPRTASLFAIDLMRTSFTACVRMAWPERLAWYFDAGQGRAASASSIAQSIRVMTHAKKLFLRYFKLAHDSEGFSEDNFPRALPAPSGAHSERVEQAS